MTRFCGIKLLLGAAADRQPGNSDERLIAGANLSPWRVARAIAQSHQRGRTAACRRWTKGSEIAWPGEVKNLIYLLELSLGGQDRDRSARAGLLVCRVPGLLGCLWTGVRVNIAESPGEFWLPDNY